MCACIVFCIVGGVFGAGGGGISRGGAHEALQREGGAPCSAPAHSSLCPQTTPRCRRKVARGVVGENARAPFRLRVAGVSVCWELWLQVPPLSPVSLLHQIRRLIQRSDMPSKSNLQTLMFPPRTSGGKVHMVEMLGLSVYGRQLPHFFVCAHFLFKKLSY